MKKTVFTIFFALFAFFTSQAQNKLYWGSQAYDATYTWAFNCSNCPASSAHNYGKVNLFVSVVKNGSTGFIAVGYETCFPELQYIGKNLYIHLADETIITCYDRGQYSNLNSRITSLYSLTNTEIDKLKKSNISMIRFSILNKNGSQYGSCVGNFSSENLFSLGTEWVQDPAKIWEKPSPSNMVQRNIMSSHATAQSVTDLFSK